MSVYNDARIPGNFTETSKSSRIQLIETVLTMVQIDRNEKRAMNKIELSVRHGTEGPMHDPYAFTEYSTEINGEVVKLHCGIDEYLEIDGKKIRSDKAYSEFESLIGYTIDELINWDEPYICKNCGCSDTETSSGYPGESFEICCKCGTVVHYDFNEKAIK